MRQLKGSGEVVKLTLRPKTDTIAAIATPAGTGGVAIVRVSGPDALTFFKKLFIPYRPLAVFESHKLYYGTVLARDNRVLDEILAVYMRAPHTYTREDVAEFHCHGSFAVLQELLEHLYTLGAVPATRGEFTKRAFLSGRIDLSQAEAVIDLLQAHTSQAAELAASQIQGALATQVNDIRDALLEILAYLEVAIDFPEDDVEIFNRNRAASLLKGRIAEPLQQLIADADHGKVYREGLQVAIAGRPNVGKSSLLNALLKEERALVTPIAGTTRDTIEEYLDLEGIPIHLIDTAGIRTAHSDSVEALGIERAQKKIEEAELVCFLVDAQTGFTDADKELYKKIHHKKHIVAFNKWDLLTEKQKSELLSQPIPAALAAVPTSTKTSQGLRQLQEAILFAVKKDNAISSSAGAFNGMRCSPNRRHRSILVRTLEASERCETALNECAPLDLLAVEVQDTLDIIGEISGHSSPEDLLDAIFNRFCIGK